MPVWRELLLDTDTPVSAFAKLRRGPFAFLLESAPAGGETWSRYTFMGTEPRAAWRFRDGVAEDWTAAKGWHAGRKTTDPLADLERPVTEFDAVRVPELGAFWGGAIGYFGYAYFSENSGALKAVAVDGVEPNQSTVDDGSYPISRPLFLYSDATILTEKPQVAAFIYFYLTNVNNEITDVGYFPAPAADLEASLDAWKSATGN